MVLYWFGLEIDDWLNVLWFGGVLSDRFALLLPPIQEGVIGIKPRGDTREKQRTIFFALKGGPFVLKSVRGKFFSALKSSGLGSIFMKSRV